MTRATKITKARAGIAKLEAGLMQSEHRVAIEPVHHFAHGVYAREVMIPAGVLAVGKIHKTVHLCIVSQGDISVYTESEGLKRIKAPCTMVCQPGTKRAIYTHEDTTWTTIHGTHETDLEEIERQFIAATYDDLALTDALKERLCLG